MRKRSADTQSPWRHALATIVDGEKRIPFLRGMLAHYLLEHGFSFQEAYQIADRIRSATQKRKKISSDRIVDLLHAHVQELFGEREIGDGIFWAPRSRQTLVEDESGIRPFSRDRLAGSLTVSGIDEDQAYRAAGRIAAGFAEQERITVGREEIRGAAMDVLNGSFGAEYAQRYEAWYDFRSSDQALPLIVLIGGSSGVGKTSAAVALAGLLSISRVTSSDEIRQVMRLMIAPDLMPAIHASSYVAWETLTSPLPGDVDPVIYGFREQALRISVGVRAVIDRAIEENVNLVVDGVHLLPDVSNLDDYEDRAILIRANLYLTDPQLYAERFRSRSAEAAERRKHRYLEHLEEINHLQEHILEIGEEYGVPAYENTDLEETVQSLSLQVMETLRRRAIALESAADAR